MSSRADNSRNTATDVPSHIFRCMGCNQNRTQAGRRGTGVRTRCAVCVSAREVA